MITHVYICNQCKGNISKRLFERQFADMQAAGSAETPDCPRCRSPRFVSRYFGHKVFTVKPCGEPELHPRYEPIGPGHQRGLLSIGIQATEDMQEEIERRLEELVEAADVTIVPHDPARDTADELLGLKKGSVERALFDIRHERMMRELQEGEPISGFYMPISGQFNN